MYKIACIPTKGEGDEYQNKSKQWGPMLNKRMFFYQEGGSIGFFRTQTPLKMGRMKKPHSTPEWG